MAQTMSTPGVYFEELDAFGNSVVPVPTAVPAFIGYTLNTSYNGKDVTFKPIKIGSLADFTSIFGSTGPQTQFSVKSVTLPSQVATMSTTATTAGTTATTAASATGVTPAVKTALDPINTAIAAATAANIAAQVTAANTELKTVTAASPQVALDVTAATATVDYANAQSTLLAAQADPDMAAYITAKTAYDAAVKAGGATPTTAQQATIDSTQAALTTATQPFVDAKTNANFWWNQTPYLLDATTINYRLFASIKLFFDNGGGHCYVYSIGGYDYTQATIDDTTGFETALTLLVQETEPTMLVIPDAIEVKSTVGTDLASTYANCYSLQNQMLDHCGTQRNRIAILDIPGGWTEPAVGTTSVEVFRDQVNPTLPKFNSYGAAYYPWLNTTINQIDSIGPANIDTKAADSYAVIFDMLVNEFTDPVKGLNNKMIPYINAFATPTTKLTSNPVLPDVTMEQADAALSVQSKSYQLAMNAIMGEMNLLPPSAAMAGIYTTVDNNEGVWVAPANVGVQSVSSPSMKIDDDAQADLNIPIDGKSVCAIRAFNGRGTLVWGARTLDGNSNDWRYVNVRRTMMFIEQSVKDAAFAYVFAPNVSNTWVDVNSMISNFLTGFWAQGGLAGSKAETSFSVAVGLGSTMTNDDIQNGIMRVAVKVAISHPAEFIDITFEQEMQS